MGVVKAKGDDAKASKYIGELILGGKIWGFFSVFCHFGYFLAVYFQQGW